jgi:predicted ferric reductase
MGDVLLGLILIPLGRNSFLPALLDIHIDAALRFHKRCGILLCLVTVAHGFVIWTKTTTLLDPPSYSYWTFNINVQGPKWIFYVSDAGFMTTFGFIAGAALIILWTFTFPTIRRRLYHIFYSIHIIFGPIMIITACLHTSSIWYYSMPGAFLLLTDWIIRLYHYTVGVKGVATREACGYIRIDVLNRMKVHVGGFVMLRIKELGYQISHPFTVASDPTANSLVLLVKPSITQAEWSYKLASLVPFRCSSKEITMQIDGPFGGLKFNVSRMNVVACFVGGVGVAGALAIASHILNYETGPYSVFIFWAARELTAGNLSVLQELRRRRDPRLCIHLYGSAATFLFNHGSENKEATLNVEVGIKLSDEFFDESLAYNIQSEGITGSLDRMIPEALLQQEVLPVTTPSGKIGIYTCGPKALMDSVQKACEQCPKTVEIHLHRESFEW